MSTPAQSKAKRTLAPRNATEDGILDAAREMLDEAPYHELTVDAIAAARSSRAPRSTSTSTNKRAVIDRLIQQVFNDMLRRRAALSRRQRPSRVVSCASVGPRVRGGQPRGVDPAARGRPLGPEDEPAARVGAVHPPARRGASTNAIAPRPAARHRPGRRAGAGLGAGAVRDGRAPHHDRGPAAGQRRDESIRVLAELW